MLWAIGKDLGTRNGSIGESPARASTYASSYVCSLLGARLASRGSLLEPESSTVHAALLLTDIEGRTSRVERLCSAGPEGLDELARSLNSYFVELTETVYGHGGDLLTVTGDAFCAAGLPTAPVISTLPRPGRRRRRWPSGRRPKAMPRRAGSGC